MQKKHYSLSAHHSVEGFILFTRTRGDNEGVFAWKSAEENYAILLSKFWEEEEVPFLQKLSNPFQVFFPRFWTLFLISSLSLVPLLFSIFGMHHISYRNVIYQCFQSTATTLPHDETTTTTEEEEEATEGEAGIRPSFTVYIHEFSLVPCVPSYLILLLSILSSHPWIDR